MEKILKRLADLMEIILYFTEGYGLASLTNFALECLGAGAPFPRNGRAYICLLACKGMHVLSCFVSALAVSGALKTFAWSCYIDPIVAHQRVTAAAALDSSPFGVVMTNLVATRLWSYLPTQKFALRVKLKGLKYCILNTTDTSSMYPML